MELAERQRAAVASQSKKAAQPKEAVQQKVVQKTADAGDANVESADPECNICNEFKKDAQRRCVCEQCDKKYCDTCMDDLLKRKYDVCQYCRNPWKQGGA